MIQPSELRERMREGRPFILIDVLPKEIYQKRRLPGAMNACVYEVTFPDQVAAITRDKSKEIVLYGSSVESRDAAEAAEKLLRLGYDSVHVLDGGVDGWLRSGQSIEGENVLPPERLGKAVDLADHVYAVSTEESVIGWTGRNANGKHYGTLRLSKGEIRLSRGAIDGAFEIDMMSIKNKDLDGDPLQPVLIAHLMSDDFFFVKLFPKASFILAAAKPVESPTLSSPNFQVEGTLELRGVKADIRFPATVNRREDGSVSIEAHFDIDRTRWNVLYGSSRFFEHLGMHLVYDLIT
ncbi:MAG: YceI family protein, partial [Desulfobacterota bacterium]|nr:YceI family protein [Thermodesulfobacteriota bacterium]